MHSISAIWNRHFTVLFAALSLSLVLPQAASAGVDPEIVVKFGEAIPGELPFRVVCSPFDRRSWGRSSQDFPEETEASRRDPNSGGFPTGEVQKLQNIPPGRGVGRLGRVRNASLSLPSQVDRWSDPVPRGGREEDDA